MPNPSDSWELVNMFHAVLLLTVCPSARPPAPFADTTRYTVTMAGNPAGSQIVWREADGTIRVRFEFNDRGRGPRLDQRTTVGAGAIPSAAVITGNDYLKAPVEERFGVEGQRARWRNNSEAGDQVTTAPAFYLPLNGTPMDLALLAQALLTAPGGRLAMLPAGEAVIERLGSKVVGAGKQQTVEHYAISGLGFSPTSIWLAQDRSLFAVVSGWTDVVLSGWESTAADLLAEQEAVRGERARSLAARLARRPKGPVVFRDVAVFDAAGASLLPDQTVVVEGNRIAAVGPSGNVPVPRDAEVVDGRGKTLLPGLWDMHVHNGAGDEGLLHVAGGVTSVRDMASDIDQLLTLRKAYQDGSQIGPRIVMAGFMDGPGPYAGPTKVLIATPDEARAAVNRYADLGYTQVKLYSSLNPELVAGIAELAHRRGLRVSGHVPRGMTAERAVLAGYDEIQHANMLFLNFLGDTLDTRTPLRFTEVAKHGADLDLAADSVRQFIRFLADRGTVVDPTVNVFEEMFTNRPGSIGQGAAPHAGRMPPTVRRGMLGGGLPVPPGQDQRYRAAFENMLALVKALHEARVTIVAGTDGMAGFALHRELELYARAGIPPGEVLRIATLGAATVAGEAARFGAVTAGRLADLYLVDGNPVADISAIRRGVVVMKDGLLYDPDALYRELGVGSWKGATP